MTAFFLPQGWMYYRVAPMGLKPSGDWWCRKSDETIAGLPGVLKLVDDILVHAPSLVELRGGYKVSCSAATQCDTLQLHLANQLGNFLPDLAVGTVKMRGLLRKRRAWVWTPDNEKEFVAVKKLLTSAPNARYFDPQLESKLLTDASRSEISFALIQEGPDGQRRLITCGSRGLDSTEAATPRWSLSVWGLSTTPSRSAPSTSWGPQSRLPW